MRTTIAWLVLVCCCRTTFPQDPIGDPIGQPQPPANPAQSTAATDGGDTANQTPAPESPDRPTDDPDEPSATSFLDEFTNAGAIGLVRRGGLFMWPILVMAVLALGVIIERYRSLSMLSTDSAALRRQVQDLLQADKVQEAIALCDSAEGPVPAVLSAGLRKYLVLRRLQHNPANVQEQVNKSMEDYSVHIVAALERHLPVLATISSVAPMLGFLGTVAGMITSFDDIQAKMGEMNIVEAAASGISVALLTTCFGLIVGIPAFMAYNYFTSVINRNVLDVEESATELIESVTLKVALEPLNKQ